MADLSYSYGLFVGDKVQIAVYQSNIVVGVLSLAYAEEVFETLEASAQFGCPRAAELAKELESIIRDGRIFAEALA